MRYWVLLLLLSFVAFTSCSVSKEAREYKSTINGNWLLESVVAEDIQGNIKVTAFNEAPVSCFIGSYWSFNRSNSLGSYDINKNGNECVAIKRDFRWSVYEEAGQPLQFQFKRLASNLSEMDNGAGYRFNIVSISDNNMSLRSTVDFEGKPASFLYKFARK